MTGIIYVIINNINGKMYVGKTTRSLADRWNEHLDAYISKKTPNKVLYKAFDKYGIENFDVDIIERFTDISQEELNEREIFGYKNMIHLTMVIIQLLEEMGVRVMTIKLLQNLH